MYACEPWKGISSGSDKIDYVKFERDKLPAHVARLHTFLRLLLFLAVVASGSFVSDHALDRLFPHASATSRFLIRDLNDFLTVLLASWFMARVEHRRVSDYGLPWRRMFRRDFWFGILAGFAAVSALVGALTVSRVFSFKGVALHGAEIMKWAVIYFLVFILVAVREEFRSRGYILTNLTELLGFWPAALATSLLFGIAHLGNRNESWIGASNAALFGLVMCVARKRTGSLWLPIGVHAAFDWGETYFYGVADSGATSPGHLFNTAGSGVDWLSGGVVGPEGSVLCTLVLVIMWTLIAWKLHPRSQPLPLDPPQLPGQSM